MGKGGTLGGFIPFSFPGGTSWKFEKIGINATTEKKEAAKAKAGESNKSPIAFVKEPIGLFFGLKKPSPGNRTKGSIKTRKLIINGVTHETQAASAEGSTGRSRSVTVKFTKLQTIGGKQVASVKIAMPSSYTMNNMLNFLTKGPKRAIIAAIVSNTGHSWVYEIGRASCREEC